MPVKIASLLVSHIIIAIIFFSSGWKIHAWKDKSEQLKKVNESIVELKQSNSAESKESVSRMKKEEVNHDQQKDNAIRVEHEISAVPVYRECIVPASGLQLINSAVESANTLIASC